MGSFFESSLTLFHHLSSVSLFLLSYFIVLSCPLIVIGEEDSTLVQKHRQNSHQVTFI